MSETLDLEETTSYFEASDEGSENTGMAQKDLDDQSERPTSPSINVTRTQTSNEEDEQPAAVPPTGQQSDERIEDLVNLFRDFLEAAPNKSVPTPSPLTQPNKAGRKRFFGLAKGFSQETGSNNRYDYEQKYPRDRFGEEVSDNSRIWFTYLDEAELFDRERAEGWKETVDVLLVFAGLFSGVITTFISQASQSLQKDNTQVSASLLFEISQVLRAQSNGMSTNMIPNSTINPNSPFTPSTNAVLVNGLWFTSLAITLSAALFAVLAKQWLYYYLTSIPGTANQKVRARQLRLNGFESWKVAAIIELLPILLHLAVGMFLTGIIILLFPLDVHIAETIVFIAGITYTSYFISVMLPIWYPECPYTTSLTIYIGILVLALRQVFQKINQGFQAIWGKINSKARFTIEHIGQSLVRHGFMLISKLGGVVHHGFQRLRSTIFSDTLPKFTKWREENIKKAVKHATSLDSKALRWLYVTSADRSVHKMIARCAAVHPTIVGNTFRWDLHRTLEVSETDVVDLRYGLCLDLLNCQHDHWDLLQSIPDVGVIENQLEGEYQTYLHLAKTISSYKWDPQTIHNAINGDVSLPLAMWHRLLDDVDDGPSGAMVAVHILTDGIMGLFNWKVDPTRELIRDAGLVRFNSEKLGWWKFGYLFRYFELGGPDYSSEAKTHEMCYLLFITIYRNLTSDDPIIINKEERQESLEKVFDCFWRYLRSPNRLSLEDALRFFTEICCVDSFWSESMTDDARRKALRLIEALWEDYWLDNNCLPLTDGHNLSLIYQWYLRDLDRFLSYDTPPLFPLLLVSQNRHHLSTILSNDPNALSHFSNCIHNLSNYVYITNAGTSIYRILMDLLKYVGPKKNSLFIILYDPSVLVQLWKLLVCCKWEMKRYFRLVKSKLERDKLDELFAAMNTLARSVNWGNLPMVSNVFYGDCDNVRSALLASVREFGQLIGMSHTQLEATADQSAPENAASDKDHDTEERAQVSEHQNYHSLANWMKNVFKSVWSKTPRQIDQ